MAHRSQCSSAGDNPLDPNYLPPHYREEYRLAIDALVEDNLDGYYEFLQSADVVDFLSRLEIEHIQSNVQNPRHVDKPGAPVCPLVAAGEGSSDTYWPTHSDLDAPSLDLGWPQQLRFVGPTEIITFVNPPDQDMPSIKTQARRLIKDAQLVIAIAMDIFTDVDIFADLLAAAMRNVAVYILLDEQNAHHFKAMVASCRVNLEQIKYMRVRTVSGIKYYCRTGKSLRGQMMERFMLIDSKAVLGGNYSFMWSYEKLHRCLAHMFLGQLVVTFDEEFRILYAQSEPLVADGPDMPIQKYSSLPELQKTHPIYPRKPGEYFPEEGMQTDRVGHIYGGRMDMDPRGLKRGDSAQILLPPQANLHPGQQYRNDRPGAFGPDALRRASFGDANSGGYYQQYMMHKERQNLDTMETQSTHSHRDQHHFERTGREPVYDVYDKFRSQRYQHMDQYSEPGDPHALQQVDNYDHMLRFLHSDPNLESGQDPGNLMVPEGPYEQASRRRQRAGQPFVCQTSPTQLSPLEPKPFPEAPPERKPRDTVARKGMRDWRIHSYLSAYDDAASEGTPPASDIDTGDDSPFTSAEPPSDFVPLTTRIGQRELAKMPSAVLPSRQKKMFPPDDGMTAAGNLESSAACEGEGVDDGAEGNMPKDEPFRRRPNPTLQRASRLRNSLLFSSNQEKHKSLFELAKPGESKTEGDQELSEKNPDKNPLKKQSTFTMGEEPKSMELPSVDLQRTSSFRVDMDDPVSRLQFFRQLAAERKAEAASKLNEKVTTKLDKSDSSLPDSSDSVTKKGETPISTESLKTSKDKPPVITVEVLDSDMTFSETLCPEEEVVQGVKGPSHATELLPQIATDAEKIQQKKMQDPAGSSLASSTQPALLISSAAQQSTDTQRMMEQPPGSKTKRKSVDLAPELGTREQAVKPPTFGGESPTVSKPALPVTGETVSAASEKTPIETVDSSHPKPVETFTEQAKETTERKGDPSQKRPKINLQRSSKLRNSLLFSSRLERHRSQFDIVPNRNTPEDQKQEDESAHSDSLTPGLLNKEMSRSEEPLPMANPTANTSGRLQFTQEKSDMMTGPLLDNFSMKRQASFTLGESNPAEFQSKVQQRSTALVDMSDPDSRLHFFRQLAAQRKAELVLAKSSDGKMEQISQGNTIGSSANTEQVLKRQPIPTESKSEAQDTTEKKPEVAQVLDGTSKTLVTESIPCLHEVKHLSGNVLQSTTLSSQLDQPATDTEKIEQKKIQADAPQSPIGSAWSSPVKDITKQVLVDDDMVVKHTPSGSGQPTVADSSCVRSGLNTGEIAHGPSSLPGKSLSLVEVSQPESISHSGNQAVDSDSSSVSSSVEMSSGTDYFTTAPTSPCTPTPTEFIPGALSPTESKCSILPDSYGAKQPSSNKTSPPRRGSLKDNRPQFTQPKTPPHPSLIKPSSLTFPTGSLSPLTGHLPKGINTASPSSPLQSSNMSDSQLQALAERHQDSGTILTSRTMSPTSPASSTHSVSSLTPLSPLAGPMSTAVLSPTKSHSTLQDEPPMLNFTSQTSSGAGMPIATKLESSLALTDSHTKSSLIPMAPVTETASFSVNPSAVRSDSMTKPDPRPISLLSATTSPVVEVQPMALLKQHDVTKELTSPLSDSDQRGTVTLSTTTSGMAAESSSPVTSSPKMPNPVHTLPSSLDFQVSDDAVSKVTPAAAHSENAIELPSPTTLHETTAKQGLESAITQEAEPSLRLAIGSQESNSNDLTATSRNSNGTVTLSNSEKEFTESKSNTTPDIISPSRYQSSTANVLSCSNLRDDTKVLLEQISANSQSRSAKQTPPTTDDTKEEEIESKDKSSLIGRYQSRRSHMSDDERDRLLTAMESKRKERRVYSRFEAL